MHQRRRPWVIIGTLLACLLLALFFFYRLQIPPTIPIDPVATPTLVGDQRPYQKLEAPRAVPGKLPEALARFYATHEGLGLRTQGESFLRFATLEELRPINFHDLNIADNGPGPRGWEKFTGYRLAVSTFGDDIIWIIESPIAAPGTIVAFGDEILGPGGTGDHRIDPTLVLANSLVDWVKRLEKYDWIEYGLIPNDVKAMKPQDRQPLINYYKLLNPKMNWD